MELPNPFKSASVGNSLKTSIINRLRKAITKPRIEVKSFAKVSCLETPVKQRNVFKGQIKTQYKEVLKNHQGVFGGLVGNEIIPPDNLQELDPLDISKHNPNSESIDVTNISSVKKVNNVKTIYYYHGPDNYIRLMDTPPPQPIPKPSHGSSQERLQEDSSKSQEKHDKKSLFCGLCNATFQNSLDFSLHSIKHNKNRKYNCCLCKYSASLEKHIKQHIMQTHESKYAPKYELCDICGMGFSSADTFSRHRRDRHWKTLGLTPPIYNCKSCNKMYTSVTGLKLHFKRHHIQGSSELGGSELCDTCGMRLSCKKHLDYHRRLHARHQPNTCNICSKRFTEKEPLMEHMRVHEGQKPFKCKYCSKGFTQRSSRTIHERTHTGERPYYICRMCSKGFYSKIDLDVHIKRCDVVTEYLIKP